MTLEALEKLNNSGFIVSTNIGLRRALTYDGKFFRLFAISEENVYELDYRYHPISLVTVDDWLVFKETTQDTLWHMDMNEWWNEKGKSFMGVE